MNTQTDGLDTLHKVRSAWHWFLVFVLAGMLLGTCTDASAGDKKVLLGYAADCSDEHKYPCVDGDGMLWLIAVEERYPDWEDYWYPQEQFSYGYQGNKQWYIMLSDENDGYLPECGTDTGVESSVCYEMWNDTRLIYGPLCSTDWRAWKIKRWVHAWFGAEY